VHLIKYPNSSTINKFYVLFIEGLGYQVFHRPRRYRLFRLSLDSCKPFWEIFRHSLDPYRPSEGPIESPTPPIGPYRFLLEGYMELSVSLVHVSVHLINYPNSSTINELRVLFIEDLGYQVFHRPRHYCLFRPLFGFPEISSGSS
jgi:hypothetical protein